MGVLKLFKRKKKESLRDYCLNKYGEEFIEKYDALNEGIPIGNIYETISFLDDVSIAKKEWQKRAGGERYGICNMLSIRSHYGDFSGYR